ncbi:pimeloyl-ACP methyl ester carboxylesterase/DNA-binding CsgD family transcriptional regulator [Caulobacter ginsengisoli]|uniref:Pimeloyl-ACP methyl ester carboxylesterase/DNA-binding CsgD family transcriptional regulator n=1 Tax=Caulobacter ginsengisoli TaxID=400775 RepID=A0ABU0INL3_9CAUL|nr:alpha/beta fold hydrolase [Caulobacter ginsengisoli]MDQ0463593.1 pimeloyl-ACP methyl ester carboxylesterase/DNA-binding CsgD family transcriptional regulator [Caulobacter ginsengisoli]
MPSLKTAERSWPETLAYRTAEGWPTQALFDAWPSLETTALHEPERLAVVLSEIVASPAAAAFATHAPASGLVSAVVSADGQTLYTDRGFRDWFGVPSDTPAFRRLIRLALKNGQVSGLVEARDGDAIACCAGLAEMTAGWPMPEACRTMLRDGGRRVVLLGFSPSRSSELTQRAAEAYGLTPLEARLAEALLDSPNLEAAAAQIGVGRETAREALKKAMRKAGAKRSPELVRKMMDLICGDHPPSPDIEATLAASFGATPAESRAAAAFARGLTAREVAADLGVKEATVRGQLKAVFAKTGVNKAKDLVRLSVETSSLAAMISNAESVVSDHDPGGRLRVLVAPGERRVAFTDYGPRSGQALFVLHGQATGRNLTRPFVAALQAKGFRPIVPQRPGFGLTDPAIGDILETAAADMAAILDALKIPRVIMLARDGAVAAGLTFAARYPLRVIRGIVVNGKWPAHERLAAGGMMNSIFRAFLANPDLIGVFSEMLRRQTRSDLVRTTLRNSLKDNLADREALEQPGILDYMVREAQAMSARSCRGFADEHAAYARGWRVPEGIGGERWLVVEGATLALEGVERVFGDLPNASFVKMPRAGLMLYISHPREMAELVATG